METFNFLRMFIDVNDPGLSGNLWQKVKYKLNFTLKMKLEAWKIFPKIEEIYLESMSAFVSSAEYVFGWTIFSSSLADLRQFQSSLNFSSLAFSVVGFDSPFS